jgi:GT2 family glycosyltransferase
VAQAVGWDAESFGGWDFYDIDFTYRAARAGYRLAVIPELGFFHQSKGAGSVDYAKYAQRFVAKHRESIRFRQFRPLQVAKQHVATLDEARVIMRPPFWHR